MSASLQAAGFAGTVNNGSLLAAIAVSMVVGVVGFLSPCVLPLVPGYLSYVAGLSGSALAEDEDEDEPGDGGPGGTVVVGGTAVAGDGTVVATRAPRARTRSRRRIQRRMVAGALLFVAGFTAIFVATGALFGTLGSQIAVHHAGLEQFFGAFTIAMGLVFIGKIPFLQREFKIHRLPRAGLLGAPVLGMTFGLAWTPCLAPTFTAVYQLATIQATAGRGAILSAAYCFGLGVPFVLVALGVGWVGSTLRVLRRHAGLVAQFGGVLLIVFGVLMLTGLWDRWMYSLNSAFAGSFIGSDL
jgi:cytochrome c-type biogenesis protein